MFPPHLKEFFGIPPSAEVLFSFWKNECVYLRCKQGRRIAKILRPFPVGAIKFQILSLRVRAFRFVLFCFLKGLFLASLQLSVNHGEENGEAVGEGDQKQHHEENAQKAVSHIGKHVKKSVDNIHRSILSEPMLNRRSRGSVRPR